MWSNKCNGATTELPNQRRKWSQVEPKRGQDKNICSAASSIPQPSTHNWLSCGRMPRLCRLSFVGSRSQSRCHTKIETFNGTSLSQIGFDEANRNNHVVNVKKKLFWQSISSKFLLRDPYIFHPQGSNMRPCLKNLNLV